MMIGADTTVGLNPDQCQSSMIEVTGSGAFQSILELPAAFPGHEYLVYNHTANNVILRVTGQTGITVATTKRAVLGCEAVDVARYSADV
jgi:hypothetical protein